MKLIYATSFAGTSGAAQRFQTLAMAKALAAELGPNFLFVAADLKFESPAESIAVRNLGLVRAPVLAWRILKLCRQEKFTHLYCREPRLLFFLVLWKFLFFRQTLKTAYEIHALAADRFWEKGLEWWLTKTVDLYVILTEAMARQYEERYSVSRKKILIASDAVDLSIFDIPVSATAMRKKYNLPLDKKIIGYFGRFKTMGMDKGINDILKALKILPPAVVFLAMGGKKNDKEEYCHLADSLGVGERVIFVEQFDQPILAEYQKTADLLLMPFPWTTHFAYYMSPLKMFEYMAAKRPIIATDLPAIREILDDKMAIIIPPGDPEALAEAVKRLLDDPIQAEKLSDQAYAKVQEYTWAKRVLAIVDFLRD